MVKGRIGIPATPKTELPMTICNSFMPTDKYYHEEVHPRRHRDPKFSSVDSNAK